MKKRLIELLEAEGGFSRYMTDDERREKLADHLLANGVIVPPCKVGETVYQTDGVRIYLSTIQKVIYDTGHIAFDESAIGESIFLTKEEAEKALAERSNR